MAGVSKSGEVRLIEFPCHRRADGPLVVAEAATGVPFDIKRMFTIAAPPAPNVAATRTAFARN